MTNYEKIKNLSVEKMAGLMAHIGNYPCLFCADKAGCCSKGAAAVECYNGLKEWLKSEVEE